MLKITIMYKNLGRKKLDREKISGNLWNNSNRMLWIMTRVRF